MGRLVILFFLAALVASPLAVGQASPQADLAIDLPPGPVGIELGATHEVPFSVTLFLKDIVCTSAATVKVPLSVKDKPSPLAGVKGTPTPAELTFEIPASSYTSAPFSKVTTSSLVVRVGTEALPDHEHTFAVTAVYAGGVPAGCQGAGSMAATDATAEHMIMTGSASGTSSGQGVPTHQMNGGGQMSGEPMGGSNKTPGASFAILVVGMVLVALVRRR